MIMFMTLVSGCGNVDNEISDTGNSEIIQSEEVSSELVNDSVINSEEEYPVDYAYYYMDGNQIANDSSVGINNSCRVTIKKSDDYNDRINEYYKAFDYINDFLCKNDAILNSGRTLAVTNKNFLVDYLTKNDDIEALVSFCENKDYIIVNCSLVSYEKTYGVTEENALDLDFTLPLPDKSEWIEDDSYYEAGKAYKYTIMEDDYVVEGETYFNPKDIATYKTYYSTFGTNTGWFLFDKNNNEKVYIETQGFTGGENDAADPCIEYGVSQDVYYLTRDGVPTHYLRTLSSCEQECENDYISLNRNNSLASASDFEIFEDFVNGKTTARYGNYDLKVYDLQWIEWLFDYYFYEEEELNCYENLDVNSDSNSEDNCKYTISSIVIDSKSGPILFTDINLSSINSSHLLYQLGIDGGELTILSSNSLSWCDWEVYYKNGYFSVTHGQHISILEYYQDSDDSVLGLGYVKVKLLLIGPADDISEELLKEYDAEDIIIVDNYDTDTNKLVDDYFGCRMDEFLVVSQETKIYMW